MKAPIERNPNWSRDELIVALDFYLRFRPSIPSKTSAEIRTLSDQLNRLQSLSGGERSVSFRNANGVYMKLMNFRRFDPDYEGAGLQRGNKDEEVVWNLYADRPEELHKVASTILSFAKSGIPTELQGTEIDEEADAEEGGVLTRVHLVRERDPKIVSQKKAQALKLNGRLVCEVCGFDFEATYRDRGAGFIECHHRHALSDLRVGDRTRLSDLALVCSNCHRMIHCRRPWLTIEELHATLGTSNQRR